MERNVNIDIIKIVAMLGVICVHANMKRLDVPTAYVMSRIFGISLTLFLMVSGYLMANKTITIEYARRKIVNILLFCLKISLIVWISQMLWNLELNIDIVSIYLKIFIQGGPLRIFWYMGALCILYALLPLYRKMEHINRNFILLLLFALIVVDFVIWMLTWSNHFEYHVRQTFRIWNWLTYFTLGVLVARHPIRINIWVGGVISVVAMFIYLVFVYYSKSNIEKIEHFYTTPVCMLYTVCVFITLMNLRLNEDSRIIKALSSLFLPVYFLHVFIIKAYQQMVDTSSAMYFSPLIDYLIIAFLSISFSFILMKMKLARSIFRI